MTRFRYGHFAAAQHLELITLQHDDRVGVYSNAEQLRVRRHYRFHVMFAMSFGNMLIYRAVGQEAKTALVTLHHHNIGTTRSLSERSLLNLVGCRDFVRDELFAFLRGFASIPA